MDVSLYLLLIVVALLILLVMWVCSSSNVNRWGPDTTLDLPPYVIQEALFGTQHKKGVEKHQTSIPSAPSELPSAPLLSNSETIKVRRPAPPPPIPAKPSFVNGNRPGFKNTAVRVLPPLCGPQQGLQPVTYKFATEVVRKH